MLTKEKLLCIKFVRSSRGGKLIEKLKRYEDEGAGRGSGKRDGRESIEWSGEVADSASSHRY